MFISSFTSRDLEFWSVNHTSIYENSALKVFENNSLWGSDVLPFSEFINIVSILFYIFIEFIIFLCTILVIYFSWYKEYIICLIVFSKFSDVLPAFTSARPVDNL